MLSAIQEAREQTEHVIEAARELKRSLMHYLFTYGPVPVAEAENVALKETEIGMVPEGWEIKKISDCYKFTKKPRKLSLKNKVPFITMNDIKEDSYYIKTFDIVDKNKIKSGTFVRNNDLLIAKITPSFENGKQGIVDIDKKYGYATTEVWPLHEISNNKIGTLYYYIKISNIRRELANKMEGTTGRQRLPKNVLSNLLMPFPKEKQQINMLNYMYFIENKINNEISKKQALDSLFKSMLEQLMTGALRVNDLEVDQCSTQA